MTTVAVPTGSRRLEYLRSQRESAMAEVEAITNHAVDENRDLTDAEQNTCEARRSRLEALDADIAVECELAERSASYRDMTSRVAPGSPPSGPVGVPETRERSVEYQSPGEYLRDFLTRGSDREAAARLDAYLRAAPHQLLADNPGIVPTPIVGPVIGPATMARPAWDATTKRPMPGSGSTFERPIINQHTAVGPQAAEKTVLPSQPMKIDPLVVTKATYGGYVNLSFQNRDWTDPAILDLLVSDLAAMYARQVNDAFTAYFEAAVVATTPVTDPTGAADWLTAMYTAAGMVNTATNTFPDTLWVSPDVWAALGSMVDGSGRPMFPTISPSNALGETRPTSFSGSIAGVRLVVDSTFSPKTAIMGDSSYVETYEQIGGQVSATEPTLLGVNIAYYGYAAWLVLKPGAFVQFDAAALPLARTGNKSDAKTTTTKTDHK
jgi:HK97 family phage major capsid protein